MPNANAAEWERAITELRETLARFIKDVGDRPLAQGEKDWINDRMKTIDYLLDQMAKTFPPVRPKTF